MDKVVGYALNEWLQDIRRNQLPGLLGGVGPMHSVVQLCESVGGVGGVFLPASFLSGSREGAPRPQAEPLTRAYSPGLPGPAVAAH